MKREIALRSTQDTEQIAKCFGEILGNGDTLLLSGQVGAGKTDFARRLIHTFQRELGSVEDVPSPTFTLVQTYELGSIEIWHADLYRLSNIDEVFELGLEPAFGSALCLVEWPERLGEMSPRDALSMLFEFDGDDARKLTLEWQVAKWNTVPDMLAFVLAQSGPQND